MSKGQMLKEKIDHENRKKRKHEKDYMKLKESESNNLINKGVEKGEENRYHFEDLSYKIIEIRRVVN